MWASLRAQTLFRTVDGMMYSEAALRCIAQLEQLTKDDVDIYSKMKQLPL
jgi:callose synthase